MIKREFWIRKIEEAWKERNIIRPFNSRKTSEIISAPKVYFLVQGFTATIRDGRNSGMMTMESCGNILC